MTAPKPHYRPDIDGLRAIAVLAVVVYHFADDNLAGGYLGVDIFFVLSGYLITQIIFADILAGNFTVRGFYERRIRRIVPALLLLLGVTAIVAVLVLLPADLAGFGRALLSTLGFVANIYAWRDTNYFARLAEEKPLLHMWSLGVEEQFYILFPLILWLVARRWRAATVPVMVSITGLSLALNLVALKMGAGTPAFYMLPTRAWELGVGAVIALLPRAGHLRPDLNLASTLGSMMGLALIGTALFFPLLLPGYVPEAVLAVAGTALLLYLGERSTTPVTRLLGFKPLVAVGLISYSLYLWHWPVIVFAKYYLIRELEPWEIAAAWVFMVTAAILSWRFVERPFRRRDYPRSRLYWGSAVGAALLAALGIVLIRSDGLPSRMNAEAAVINAAVGTNYRCDVSDYLAFGASRACTLNLPSRDPADADVVLVGNSHAQMYAPVWRDIIEQRGLHGLLVPLNSCLPTVTANVDLDCLHMAKLNDEAIGKLPRAKTVILAMTWNHAADALVGAGGGTLENGNSAAQIAAIDDMIAKLRAQGRRVVLVGPIEEPGWDVASEVSRKLVFGQPMTRPLEVPVAEFRQRFGAVLAHFANRDDVAFVRPDLVQCDDRACHFLLEGRSLFADSNHIAKAELGRFRALFEPALAP